MKKVILEGAQTRSLTKDEWKVFEEALFNVKDISVLTNSKLKEDEEKLITKTIVVNEELKVHFLKDNVPEKAKKAIFALLKKIKKATISAFALIVAVFETLLIFIEGVFAFLIMFHMAYIPLFVGGYMLRSRTRLKRNLRQNAEDGGEEEKEELKKMGFYSPFVVEDIYDFRAIPALAFLKRMLGFREKDEQFLRFIRTDCLHN